MIASAADLAASVQTDAEPPAGLSPELRSLWYAKKGRWDDAHTIAQDIDTSMGSWIHAHLHLIEGDLWNAGYWYRKAGKPERDPGQIPQEWDEIVSALLG